jgi:hypothetical protein
VERRSTSAKPIVWTLHDRKAWRIGVNLDRDDEALEAAGLAE